MFGSISACLLAYKHSRGWLTHSRPWARSCVSFTSWLNNLREEEKSASPVPVSYEIKWLAKLSRKKLQFPFEVLEVFDDLFWLQGQEAGEGRSEQKRDRGPWISDVTNDWFSYLSVCANDPGCHSWVNCCDIRTNELGVSTIFDVQPVQAKVAAATAVLAKEDVMCSIVFLHITYNIFWPSDEWRNISLIIIYEHIQIMMLLRKKTTTFQYLQSVCELHQPGCV